MGGGCQCQKGLPTAPPRLPSHQAPPALRPLSCFSRPVSPDTSLHTSISSPPWKGNGHGWGSEEYLRAWLKPAQQTRTGPSQLRVLRLGRKQAPCSQDQLEMGDPNISRTLISHAPPTSPRASANLSFSETVTTRGSAERSSNPGTWAQAAATRVAAAPLPARRLHQRRRGTGMGPPRGVGLACPPSSSHNASAENEGHNWSLPRIPESSTLATEVNY